MTSFADIWHRILFTTDLEKNSDSAVLVGTTPQYIFRMKNKDEFSVAWAFEVAQKYGLNTDWIMTGKGSMKSSESEPEFHNELLHEIDKWLTGQIEKEPFLDAFPLFAEWKKSQGQEEGNGTSIQNKVA